MSRKIRKEEDPKLIEMCVECKHKDCNGVKCPEYKYMERVLAGKESAPATPSDAAKPTERQGGKTMPPRRKSGLTGLRLFNMAIDMLHDLQDECDSGKREQLEAMEETLRKWRLDKFAECVDWYALENVDSFAQAFKETANAR